jgi:hypothetical protein
MCFKKIAGFFKSRQDNGGLSTSPPVTTTTPTDGTQLPLSLTHPEEPPDYSRTMENVNASGVITKWLKDWEVPAECWDVWRTKIIIKVDNTLPYPAGTWDEGSARHLAVRPEWLNPGVIAHEQAHNSYALLSEQQKANFEKDYKPLINTEPVIKYLYSINAYGLTNIIEGHAEVYRYIGRKMPEFLKKYYPKLF